MDSANCSLLSIDMQVFAMGYCITGIIVGRVKHRVTMQFMNE